MHGESKVDGCRTGREALYVALGREDEDFVLEEVDLERLHELLGVAHFAQPLHNLPEPGYLLLELRLSPVALFVKPVGCDSPLGDVVHFTGADLNLERLARRSDHRRVERLVHV